MTTTRTAVTASRILDSTNGTDEFLPVEYQDFPAGTKVVDVTYPHPTYADQSWVIVYFPEGFHARIAATDLVISVKRRWFNMK